MTAPKPLEAIDVECPHCWASVGERCYAGFYRDHYCKPHAARIRAASPLPGGKEKT